MAFGERSPGASGATGATGATHATPGDVRAFTAGGNPTSRPFLRGWVLSGVIIAVFAASAQFLFHTYDMKFGFKALALATIAAAIPLMIVVPTFMWLDRYEAEPRRYLMFAFGWGALVAVIGALFLNTRTIEFLYNAGVGNIDFTGPVMVAPIVEETVKGLGVFLIFLARRREFDGIIDGVVYAGIIGAGFAFSENVLYLSRAYVSYGEQGLTALFFLRCLMGPFAHSMFTAAIGVGIGIAVQARSAVTRIVAIAIGWLCAMLLHALWNYSASLGGDGFFGAYVTMQVPLFLAFLIMVVVLRRREARLIGTHLSPYADAGWFTHAEVRMLSSMGGRRVARAWAKQAGGSAGVSSMRAFQDAASELALLRSRMSRGAASVDAPEIERRLLDSLVARRQEFLGSPVT